MNLSMTIEIISEQDFLPYALQNYFSDTHINTEEFNKSLKTITYINRLLKKEDNINHRLILNHIIITTNTFGIEPTVNMLFSKISKDRHAKLASYLLFLNYLSDNIITIDAELLDILENL
jgi:hypothetical protein